MADATGEAGGRGARLAWAGCAAIAFAASLAVTYAGWWGSDPTRAVPLPHAPGAVAHLPIAARADYQLAVWAVGRNAHALVHDPLHLFEAEPCYPVRHALALHHPVIAPALLALPALPFRDDPVLSFNLALLGGALLAATAMALLVADWTAMPAAGIAAGVLYAFHEARVARPYHFFTTDNAWLLLALWFAWRLADGRRRRDAVGLGLAAGLQSASSFYPFLAAVAVGLPFAIWLAWRRGLRALPWARLALAAGIALAIAAAVFWPYLTLEGGEISARSQVFYAPWSRFLPGGLLFPGWACLLLAVAGLAAPRRRVLAGASGDPRPALLVGALLVAWLATGGNASARMAAFAHGEPAPPALPNLFAALAAVLPGLDSVRLPSALAPGVVELSCVFAGLGFAALVGLAPARARPVAALVLLALVWVEALRPAALGLEPRVAFGALELRPPRQALDLFSRLDALGDRGPLLELPIDRSDRSYSFGLAPEQQLLSAYHHRRTSGCYSSFIPKAVRALGSLPALDAPGALERVRELGFRTIVVHRVPGAAGRRAAAAVRRAARASGGRLVPLARSGSLSAWGLRAAAESAG